MLDWRNCRRDRFIAALCLGALHGESHRTPNCFSNRMPRTISTKPGYSIRWWRKNSHEPPCRDVFEILPRMIDYRFRTPPPESEGQVVEADARQAGGALPSLTGRVTDVITSPPYLNTTNFREDQWLRLWFLGGRPGASYDRQDDRYYCKEQYWKFVTESVEGWRGLLAERARVVVRIGGRRFSKSELREGLSRALATGLDREVALTSSGFSSTVSGTQANAFRGAKRQSSWNTISVSMCDPRAHGGSPFVLVRGDEPAGDPIGVVGADFPGAGAEDIDAPNLDVDSSSIWRPRAGPAEAQVRTDDRRASHRMTAQSIGNHSRRGTPDRKTRHASKRLPRRFALAPTRSAGDSRGLSMRPIRSDSCRG